MMQLASSFDKLRMRPNIHAVQIHAPEERAICT